MYDLAIIGGMGPMATAELFNRIVAYTDATCDQEHLRIAVLNDPTIPDRTAHLCENGPTPLPQILEHVKEAKQLECKFFAVPCNTSHAFVDKLESVEGIEFINMVAKTCKCAIDCAEGHGSDVKICVLATQGTYTADVYKKQADALKADVVYPSNGLQQDVMDIIRLIKAGKYDASAVAGALEDKLAEEFDADSTIFILACTELSLLLPELTGKYVDSLDVLAKSILKTCGKKVKN